jgi:hypothetical protein
LPRCGTLPSAVVNGALGLAAMWIKRLYVMKWGAGMTRVPVEVPA